MNQLDELKAQRTDRQPPLDGLERAMALGGRRRRRAQRLALTGVVVVAAAGITIPSVWPSQSDNAQVSAAPSASATPSSDPGTAAESPLQQLISVPASRFEGVSTAGLSATPSKVSGAPLILDGKPGIFYYGAEYSPFSAGQRWPLVLALSRFGTWSRLDTTTSSATDVFKSTPSFTFFGSSYSSPYLTFQSVESTTNEAVGNGYAPLQTPTAAQSALINTYDTAHSIPFIDFGNSSVLVGSSYDLSVLEGKTASEIAGAATDPSTDIGRSILGTANTMTAAICDATGGQPGSVCDSPTISQLRATLDHS